MRGRLARGGRLTATLALAAALLVPDALATAAKPRQTLFIGVDTSGSFARTGYEDATRFLAYYIYGHLNGLKGLAQPRELFVAPIGGRDMSEPKAFHPIHDFQGKSIEDITRDLRQWFPPRDTLTDFNAFFRQVERITKERNLVLAPITVLIVSDGVPDIPGTKPGSSAAYRKIDLSGLEYLARNVTLRVIYVSPTVADSWRTLVPRQRVRLWAVAGEVMRGWHEQLAPDAQPEAQERLWDWVKDNLDYRVRRGL